MANGIKLQKQPKRVGFDRFNNRYLDEDFVNERISRNRRMADMLMGQNANTVVQSPTQGLAMLARALNARDYNKLAQSEQDALRDQRNAEMGAFLQNLTPDQQANFSALPRGLQMPVAAQIASNQFATPEPSFRLATPEERSAYNVPESSSAQIGPDNRMYIDDAPAPPVTNINLPGETPPDSIFSKDNKTAYDRIAAEQEVATKGFTEYSAATDALKAIDDGAFVGIDSPLRTALAQAVSLFTDKENPQLGAEALQRLAATEAFSSAGGVLVGSIIRLFGSGTGLSDADREFAAKIAGALPTTSPQGLVRILTTIQQRGERQVQKYNNLNNRFQQRFTDVDVGFETFNLQQKTAEDYIREARESLGNP